MDQEVMIRFVEKSEIPVAEVIAEHIVSYCAGHNIAVSAMGPTLLMIMKGTTPEKWAEVHSSRWCRQSPLTEDAVEFIKSWGKEFPFIQILEGDGEVRINYQRQLVLDFRDPRFFDHLEKVLVHALEQGDLSQFSL
jgi:hypothetical protein